MPTTQATDDHMSVHTVISLGVMFLGIAALLVYLLVILWPPAVAAGISNAAVTITLMGRWSFTISAEMRLIFLVIIAAGVGSFVHAATSFSTFVGNRTITRSWLWWYLLRHPIGISLALLFYFALRGGLFSSTAGVEVINPFGTVAIAGLVGMFSKQATDKLRELFDVLFRTNVDAGDHERKDKPDATQVDISVQASAVARRTAE